MPSWTDDLNGMMGQLMATHPTASSSGGGLPNEPGVGGGGGGAGGGNYDWSWLQHLNPFQGTWEWAPGVRTNWGELSKSIGGAFQTGPESDLATQIFKHEMERGVPMHQAAAYSSWLAKQAQTDPNLRLQISQSLGWNQTNPEVQRWVAQGGAAPQAPTDQPVAPKGGPATGTTGTQQAPADPSAASVQNPFPAQFFNNPNYHGNNYGDPKPAGTYWGGWQWHQGQDYGVPQGTALSFPFAGKVVQVGYEPHGYGNFITVEFGNGLRMTYAHLSYVQAKEGDAVTPGEQIGLSGGDGPGAGISTGAHLLVVLHDSAGHPVDPRPLLGEIYKGTTLGKLQGLGVAATGSPDNAGSYMTPDGHQIFVGTPEDQFYSLVAAPYEHYYGVKPPWSLAMAMKQQGIQNSDQMAAVAANWPSDIPGISFGVRENIYNNANAIAMKEFGRPIPDSLVKQFAQQGVISNNSIQLWFDSHLPADMPKEDYQQLYDAANPMMQDTYGDGASPEYYGYLWGQTQAPPGGTSAAAATGTTAPPLTTGGTG